MSYMMGGAVERIAILMMIALAVAFSFVGLQYVSHDQRMGMIGILSIPIVMVGGFFLPAIFRKGEEKNG